MKFTSSSLKQRESARKYAHRRQTGELVRRRWEQDGRKCEGCGQVIDVIEVAHVFGKGGRRAGIPEVWASTPALCAALCCAASYGDRIGCHELLDRHLDAMLSATVEKDACMRLWQRLGSPLELTLHTVPNYDYTNVVRSMIRHAEAKDIAP